MAEKLFQARFDITHVIDNGYGDNMWQLKGQIRDVSGSFTANDVQVGDAIIITGVSVNGITVYDQYLVVEIFGHDAVNVDLKVQYNEEGNPKTMNGTPNAGAHLIGRIYDFNLMEMPSAHEVLDELRKDQALVNLNFKKLVSYLTNNPSGGLAVELDTASTEFIDNQTLITTVISSTDKWKAVACSHSGRVVLASTASTYPTIQGRLYLSINSGNDWVEVRPAGDNDLLWYAITMDSTGDILMAAVLDGRVYRSEDRGNTWEEIRPAGDINKSWYILSCDYSGDIILAGALNDRVYLSADGGNVWTDLQPTGDEDKSWFIGAISGNGATLLIATTYANQAALISTDGGDSWESIIDILGLGVGTFVMSLAVGYAGDKVVVGTNNGVFTSYSSSEFEGSYFYEVAGYCRALCFVPDSNIVFAILNPGQSDYCLSQLEVDNPSREWVHHKIMVSGYRYDIQQCFSLAVSELGRLVYIPNYEGLLRAYFKPIGGIHIPKLTVFGGRYYVTSDGSPVTDSLWGYWEATDKEFLNYNPEIWLYHKTRRRRKWESTEGVKIFRNKNWHHPPHLNGSKYPSSRYYSSRITHHPLTEVVSNGLNTEWPLTSEKSLEKQLIPVDPFEFIYEANSSTKLTASTFESLTYSLLRMTTKVNRLSKGFKFAIVIDNPDPSENAPKLRGPLSDEIYLLAGIRKEPSPQANTNMTMWARSPKSNRSNSSVNNNT